MKNSTTKGPEKRQQIRCWNGYDGCGRLLDIIRFSKEAQQIEAENYHPGARLCLPCCNKLAYDWKISFEDVDFVLTAKHNARAGKLGKEPTKEEVWALMAKAGVVRKEKAYYQKIPAAMPVGDR